MSAPKKKKIQRKTEKRYEMVKFELDLFDGEFEVPSFKQVPTGVQRKAMKGDINVLAEFLGKYAGEDVIEAFDDMDEEESTQFMEAWAKASGVDLGK